jgi:hypothetical protein
MGVEFITDYTDAGPLLPFAGAAVSHHVVFTVAE